MDDDFHVSAALLAKRNDLHLFHQVADSLDDLGFGFGRVVLAARRFEAFTQIGDAAGVGLGRLRVERDGLGIALVVGQGGQFSRQGRPLRLHARQPRLDGLAGQAGDDGVHRPLDAAVEFGQALLQRRAPILSPRRLTRPGGMIGADIGLDGGGVEKLGLEAFEHAQLDGLARHRAAVGAGGLALLAEGGAHQTVAAVDDIAAAAAGALQQSGERPAARLAALPSGRLAALLGLAALGGAEDGRVDDRQMRHGGALPLALRPNTRQALACARVLADFEAIPDLHAGVEFGVEDTVGAAGRAADGAGVPQTAARPGHALAVQPVGHGPAGQALIHVEPEDVADGLGLGRDDLLGAAGGRAVAVEARAGGHALLGVADHTALGLGAEVGQVLLGHGAVEGDVKRLDLVVGQGGQPHPGEAQAGGDVGHVGEVARQAVLVLDQHAVDRPGLGGGQQGEEARPVGHGRAADGLVVELGRHRPAARLGVPAAQGELIFNRSVVLTVGAVAGIESNAHRRARSGLGGLVSRRFLLGGGIVRARVSLGKRLDQPQEGGVEALGRRGRRLARTAGHGSERSCTLTTPRRIERVCSRWPGLCSPATVTQPSLMQYSTQRSTRSPSRWTTAFQTRSGR